MKAFVIPTLTKFTRISFRLKPKGLTIKGLRVKNKNYKQIS